MNKPLFITACILAFITILVYSFVASTIYKRTTCQNSPYYFCDTSWTCCTSGNSNCLASKSSAFGALKVDPPSLQSYKITDVIYGGKNPDGITKNNYQKFCIDPVNAMVAQYGSGGDPLSLTCLYQNDINLCSPLGVQTYITTNDLLGKCNYSKFDQNEYYPSTGSGDGNWSDQALGYSSAYPKNVYNNLDGTNTKPYSCFNSLYGGNNPSGGKAYTQC
jgi:hypothetical protein